jgi:RNA polymerase sigma factor (sigma-70 family)
MTDSDTSISAAVARERARLRAFIRRRVPNPADAEDILQDVFSELVEATRLLHPIEHVGAWLFRVARNRITDLFRRSRPAAPEELTEQSNATGESSFEDLLPSPDAGPEAAYARHLLLDELTDALDELPHEQRSVFIAHELDGVTFKELSTLSGVPVNTLLSRKRYAVLHLRRRLQSIHEEFAE